MKKFFYTGTVFLALALVCFSIYFLQNYNYPIGRYETPKASGFAMTAVIFIGAAALCFDHANKLKKKAAKEEGLPS